MINKYNLEKSTPNFDVTISNFFGLNHIQNKFKERSERNKLKPIDGITGWFTFNHEFYYIRLAVVRIISQRHPLENYEPIILKNDGEFEQYSRIDEILKQLKDNRENISYFNDVIMAMNCGKIMENPLMLKCVLYLYSIKKSKNNFSFDEEFKNINNLVLKNNTIKFFELGKFDDLNHDKKLKTFLKDLNNVLYLNPSGLSTYVNKTYFTLGITEIGSLGQLNQNSPILPKYDLLQSSKPYYIGKDVKNRPVWFQKPLNILYLGNVEKSSFLYNLPFIKKSITLVDKSYRAEFYQESRKLGKNELVYNPNFNFISIEDIIFNLLALLDENSQVIRTLFNLWENLLPSNRKEIDSRPIADLLYQFLELKRIFEGESYLLNFHMHQMLKSETFRNYSQHFDLDLAGLANERFEYLFKSDIFNREKVESYDYDLERIISATGHCIINISSLKLYEKIALIILFMALKHYNFIDENTWLFFNLNESQVNLEYYLSEIRKEIEIKDCIIEMENLSKFGSFMQDYDVIIMGDSIQNQNLDSFMDTNNYIIQNRLFVKQNYEETFVFPVPQI